MSPYVSVVQHVEPQYFTPKFVSLRFLYTGVLSGGDYLERREAIFGEFYSLYINSKRQLNLSWFDKGKVHCLVYPRQKL